MSKRLAAKWAKQADREAQREAAYAPIAAEVEVAGFSELARIVARGQVAMAAAYVNIGHSIGAADEMVEALPESFWSLLKQCGFGK